MDRSRASAWLMVTLLLAACGGGDEAVVAGTPVEDPPVATEEQDAAVVAEEQQERARTELVREAFSYRGAGRDPFLSLLRSGDVRPMPQDLRVRVINYDPRYPQRSVVTLEDTTQGRRYNLRVGDQVGRVRVVQIRETEVVVTIDEFGVERQFVLPIRRRQEGNTP